MMNIQNLLNQLQTSTNPLQMMMSVLNPNQQQAINLFKTKPNQQQAEEIAKKCNELGLSKDDLAKIVQSFVKR